MGVASVTLRLMFIAGMLWCLDYACPRMAVVLVLSAVIHFIDLCNRLHRNPPWVRPR